MLENNKTEEKSCLFYVSDYHFEMIALPYVKEKIDDNNQVINFYSYIDAVNYLTKLGWNLKETYTVNTFAPTMPKEFEWLDVVHCIMEKMISSDDEKLDGLKLSSFTKNENKEKTSIQNEGKKKIVLSKRRHN